MAVKKILVVDDEPSVAASVALKIGRLDHLASYDVDTCASARQALQMVGEQYYSMVITDIRMPFTTGIQLVKELRCGGFSGVVLVLSGHDDFEYVRESFVNGADDYMLKPVSVKELDRKFQEFLNKKADDEGEKLDDKLPRHDIIAYAVKYIHENYRDSTLTMEDAARHISVSYSYFSSLFRKEMGTTFPSYLRKLRIEKSIELLEDPGLKISDISYQVGFKYPQQFSNDFKKVMGCYPSQYARKE